MFDWIIGKTVSFKIFKENIFYSQLHQLITQQNPPCVYVSVCSLSFKCFSITGNHRQIARVKVPVDVKPFRKHTPLTHTVYTSHHEQTCRNVRSWVGLRVLLFCFKGGSCYPISYLRNRFYVNAVANTTPVSPYFWVVSQPASQLIHPCQGQIVGWRSGYLRHISDTALWFQGIVLSQILQNQVSLVGSGCTRNHRGGSSFSVHIC